MEWVPKRNNSEEKIPEKVLKGNEKKLVPTVFEKEINLTDDEEDEIVIPPTREEVRAQQDEFKRTESIRARKEKHHS
jgi:hypothetical protein